MSVLANTPPKRVGVRVKYLLYYLFKHKYCLSARMFVACDGLN